MWNEVSKMKQKTYTDLIKTYTDLISEGKNIPIIPTPTGEIEDSLERGKGDLAEVKSLHSERLTTSDVNSTLKGGSVVPLQNNEASHHAYKSKPSKPLRSKVEVFRNGQLIYFYIAPFGQLKVKIDGVDVE